MFEILNVDSSLHSPKMASAQDVKIGAVIVVALVGVVCPDKLATMHYPLPLLYTAPCFLFSLEFKQ